ncbi:hypothetical protein D9V37_09295 [Nocardioides mangrovicus]|uniref:Peptidase M10 metallopeptidase domain-containing protein n=1 Tax=Nocardioides mangrovicus TaxID=2478913 RepID=A0A3L8P4X1_9ACTN|nr:hypothetical protein D9V37_09295 [Nocardioides mangrovicus]
MGYLTDSHHDSDSYSEAGLPSHPTHYADGTYRFMRTQPLDPTQPVGYNPCRFIEVEINYADATPTIAADVERIARDMLQVSGLHLRYVGASQRTHLAPPSGRILVSFTRASNDTSMNDAIAGRGGSSSYTSGYPDQTLYYVGGTVTLNADTYNRSTHDQQLLILAHEFGHAVGLAHAPGAELMNADAWGYRLHHWAHGDLTGLARLGELPCR